MINKKAGFNLGRDAQEKITDGARSAYEKYSGYVFPLIRCEKHDRNDL